MLRSAEGASGGPGLPAGAAEGSAPPATGLSQAPRVSVGTSVAPRVPLQLYKQKNLIFFFFFFSHGHAHGWSRLFSAPQVLALQIQLKQGCIQGLGTGMSSLRASLATVLALLVALLSAAGAEGHSSRHHVLIPPAASPGPAGSC